MNKADRSIPLAISKIENYLIVAVQECSDDNTLLLHKKAILQHKYLENTKGLILDFNAVHVLDSFACDIFIKITKSLQLMHIPVIWTSLNPGIVSSLVDIEVDIKNIYAARTMEDALNLLKKMS
ncbi:STAS domain-containing protein [Pectinatus sottacetonis]|uniref:STAS domain-containing protein n=1 Tax=Pectinatus sottacetonis TaxID=1002795 RepID=UPI001E32E683|nr:STAS domain-containing protein [Pectinatus sottacetonis]